MLHSVIMSEDGQFCAHRGVDLAELNVAIEDVLEGERVRGASTITMQTVKNLYLWHRPFGTVRKALELPLAVYFDVALSKKRIIEIYMNIAEWGPNIYGIEAAAQYHFGKSAKSLSARQAALLAVTLPNPIDRDPAMDAAKDGAARVRQSGVGHGEQVPAVGRSAPPSRYAGACPACCAKGGIALAQGPRPSGRGQAGAAKIAPGAPEHGGEHDRAAEQARRGRRLAEQQRGEENGEGHFGRTEQAGFGGRDQPGAFGPQHRGKREGCAEGNEQQGVPRRDRREDR